MKFPTTIDNDATERDALAAFSQLFSQPKNSTVSILIKSDYGSESRASSNPADCRSWILSSTQHNAPHLVTIA